jgi:uncharacterized damage-inducible protein DinB
MIELAMTELWLRMRLREDPMPRPFRWEQMPINEHAHDTFPKLEAAWLEQAPRTRAMLEGITDWSTIVQTVMYGTRNMRTLRATKGDIATQLLLHEVHHRAQAMTMLRHLGVAAEDLDYIFFVQQERAEPIPPG